MSSSTTNDFAVRASGLTKRYRLYRKPLHRFLDMYGLLLNAAGKCTEHTAVDNLSFEVRRGEKVAIIGRNGAGKSTLLKMICGVVTPTAGSIEVDGEVHALLSLGTGFHPDFTGRENVYSHLAHLGIVGAEADRQLAEIIDFAELHEYIDQPVKTYSAGMGVRLMFSTATVIRPDILVIDEVLGAGDAYFSKKSFERMQELCEAAGTTLLMVTHDLYSAVTFCDRMIWIDRGAIRMDGPGKSVLRAYEESIRDQEEQRLRRLRLATMEANLRATPEAASALLPAYLQLAPGDGAPMDFAVSHIRFLDAGAPLAQLGMESPTAPAAEQSAGAVLVLDPKEGSWGDLEPIDGRDARRMRPYGSIFHKLPLVITSAAVADAARYGRLAVVIGYRAGRPHTAEFTVLDAEGRALATGRFETETNGWTDVTVPVLLVERTAAPTVAGSGTARHGQRAMEIMGVQFLDAGGNERMRFTVGATMRVRLAYRLNKPDFDERPTLIVAFQQNGIVRSHRLWTDRVALTASEHREGFIEVVAAPLLLGAGTYFVTVSAFQQDYLRSPGPKKFFTANDQLYDMHARAYEVVVEPSAREPFCNDVIFQHPSVWYLNGTHVVDSIPHVDGAEPAPTGPEGHAVDEGLSA